MAKTSFNLPKLLKTELKIAAAKEDRDMGAIVAEALETYLAKKGDTQHGRKRQNG